MHYALVLPAEEEEEAHNIAHQLRDCVEIMRRRKAAVSNKRLTAIKFILDAVDESELLCLKHLVNDLVLFCRKL
jgi:hypothetical protein